MDDTQANMLRERILEECPLKKKNPSKDEMHSILSKPFNVEFEGMGLFIQKSLVEGSSLDCIKSKFASGKEFEIKEVKKGYVVYEPIK